VNTVAELEANRSMRFAYADPPYPGQARKHYGSHQDFGGEVDHKQLIAVERDFPDGWALSTSASALRQVLDLCPPGSPNPKRPGTIKEGTGVRILIWGKPNGRVLEGTVTYSWEAVIMRGGRRPPMGDIPPRDLLVCPLFKGTTADERNGRVFAGRKPPPFCRWLFECLGAEHGDKLVDLFPGSGAIGRAWDRYVEQPRLPPATKDRRYKGKPGPRQGVIGEVVT
jgi:hypothetical protein